MQPGIQPRRFDYIDALRGIAVTGVVASHVKNMFPDMAWRVHAVFEFGAHGVQLFFVASALTLMLSWTARHDGAVRFYTRRLFRIAPMFWLATLVYAGLHWLNLWPEGGDATDILLTLLFVHGWSTHAINLVVPGGWTIGVEMTFYALFPLLAAIVVTRDRAILFLIASITFAVAANTLAPLFVHTATPQDLTFFIYYWFPHALPSFAFGCLAYHVLPLAPRSVGTAGALRLAVPILAVGCAWAVFPWFSDWSHPLSRALVAPAIAALLALALAAVPAPWVVNRLTCHIGKVSFSAYLLHFLVYEPLRHGVGPIHAGRVLSVPLCIGTLIAVMTVTVLLSGLTYRLIEQPCIRAGSRLIRRWAPGTAVA